MYKLDDIVLRAIEPKDLEFIRTYVNDYELYSTYTDSPVTPKSYKEVEDWSKRRHESIISFAIALQNGDNIIGTCQLREIDHFNGTSYLSIILGDKNFLGKGYGTKALDLLLSYGFNELNLRKISLRVYEDNKGAIKLYKKCAFTEEGLLKEEIYRQGSFSNQIQMSVLKEEFLNKKNLGGR